MQIPVVEQVPGPDTKVVALFGGWNVSVAFWKPRQLIVVAGAIETGH